MLSTRALVLLAGLTLSPAVLGAVSFGPSADLATAQRPGGAASADFNADGFADLAVAVDTVDRILIFSGAAGGAFTGPATIITGSNTGPDALKAVDVNGDGQPDLVAVLKNQNSVRVYLNNAGTFTPGASAPTGLEPVSLDAADLDNDGDVDFVTANREGNTVTVLTNNAGVFASADFAAGQEPRDAAPIDLDADGAYEIAVSSNDDRTIRVLASGVYTLQQTVNVTGGTRPEGIVAADLDGDGDTDIASALSDDAFSLVGIYLNNAGSLGAQVSVAVNGLEASDILAADFDLDGDMDLVTSNQDSNTISVLDNSGAGVFAAGVATAAGTRPGSLAAGDFDGNGSPDLAVTNRDSNTTTVWLSDASGGPEPCNQADLAEPFGILDLADVSAFIAAFTSGDPVADLALPAGVFDLADVTTFISAFQAGCP